MQKHIDSIVSLLGRNCHNVFFRIESETEYRNIHQTLKKAHNFYMPGRIKTFPCLLHFVEISYPDEQGSRRYGFINKEGDLKKEGVNVRDDDIVAVEFLSRMIAEYDQ